MRLLVYRSRGQRGRRLSYVRSSTDPSTLSHTRSLRAIILVPCLPKLTHPLRVCLWNTVDSVEKITPMLLMIMLLFGFPNPKCPQSDFVLPSLPSPRCRKKLRFHDQIQPFPSIYPRAPLSAIFPLVLLVASGGVPYHLSLFALSHFLWAAAGYSLYPFVNCRGGSSFVGSRSQLEFPCCVTMRHGDGRYR